MRARLERLGVARRRARRPSTPLRSRSCATSGRGGRADPAVEGARCSGRSPTRCRRRTSSGRGRSRDGDRVGQEPAHRAGRATSPRSASTTPPIPRRPDARASTARYEARKASAGLIDFEDLLELRDPALRRRRAGAARASASATAPSRSTSTRTSTCCSRRCSTAGSATATTSASSATTTSRSTASPAPRPEHLLALPRALPARDRVRLEENYRSTPQVLELANRLVPRLGGAREDAAGDAPDGPEPEVRPFADGRGRGRVHRRADSRCTPTAPLEEIAVLCRTNARLGRLRGGARTRRGSRSRARRCWRARRRGGCCALSTPSAPAGEVRPGVALEPAGCRGLPESWASASSTRQADLAPPRQARGGVRRRRAPSSRAELERALRSTADARRGVHLLTLPRRQGARVRRGLPAAARGEGAADQAGADARRASPRSAGSSTSG